eukprot:CAMPEP_0196572900 /NCGR_PEP_ID=MMETSP1081-20130531/2870_1 /TAXON_ID=36882 /ORGANISM="Pyramimonas amylifera, Strain CCMP720" /LENGTH=324 /DNA_ID=CAMNT_0041890389 /DNA_START=206 /DNA_END=1180 /DNA_ORIENTATION=+
MQVIQGIGGAITGTIGAVISNIPFVGVRREPASVISGKDISAIITDEIKVEISAMKEKTGKVPGLAVVIVGIRKDSQTYVNMKRKKCAEVGIASFDKDLPETATQQQVLDVVKAFNADPNVHGILVQLPLPKHIDEQTVLAAISIEKDVDGFHPLNIGQLSMKGRDPLFVPCTPKGCIELLDRTGVQIAGKHAVVVGRSNIVGMPAAMLLLKRDATVTIVHSRTTNIQEEVKRADIIIACCGQPAMVKNSWVKPGVVIIDVGTNAVTDTTKKAGFRLVGDCDYMEVRKVASAISPVPGGVGPMTIAMLLRNTCDSGARALMPNK